MVQNHRDLASSCVAGHLSGGGVRGGGCRSRFCPFCAWWWRSAGSRRGPGDGRAGAGAWRPPPAPGELEEEGKGRRWASALAGPQKPAASCEKSPLRWREVNPNCAPSKEKLREVKVYLGSGPGQGAGCGRCVGVRSSWWRRSRCRSGSAAACSGPPPAGSGKCHQQRRALR